MTSLRRPLLLLAGVVLLGGVAAFLVWSPLGLLEESAGPLDGMLPPDVDAAVRFDPGALAWSPAAATLWDHAVVRELRADTEIEERVLEPLRDLERRLGRATLGLAPRVDRDVLGQEAVVAMRGEDALLLSRLTTRGKLLDAASRLDVAELQTLGLTVRGDVATLSRGDAPAIHLRRVRDVLVVSTSTELLATAAALGEPPEGVVRGRSRYAAALRPEEPPGTRVFFWVAAGRLGAPPGGSASSGALGLLGAFFPRAGLGAMHGEVDAAALERVTAWAEGDWVEPAPDVLSALAEGVGGGADGLYADAARFAVPGEAILGTGLAVRAHEAVRALAAAQPPARRELLDAILAERDLTVDLLAERIAAHLQDGIAAVVSRLPEADDLQLDDPRAGGVHAIPATLVVFRLRSATTADAVVLELAAEAEALFGAPLDLTPEDGPGGARLHRLRKHRFGGEWALLRPAIAVVDGLLVFSTHDAHLVRALEHRASGSPLDAPMAPAGTAALRLNGAQLRRYVDDQRWEWADRESQHDWRAERQAIRRELDEQESVLSREDRQVYEDQRIAMRLERRNTTEFPDAIARYREMWRPLEVLRALTLRGDRDGASFRVSIEIELDREAAR